jgi:hypothetical protein
MLGGHPAQRDPGRKRHLRSQGGGDLPDHDRFGVVRDEPVPDQGLVQARGVIVAPGLPLHPADRRVGPVVLQGLRDQQVDRVRVGTAEMRIGDEATPAVEGGQPQRTEPGDRDRIGRLRLGAQLFVVEPQEVRRISHRRPG